MKTRTRIELKFLVPSTARRRLRAQLVRGAVPCDRMTIVTQYLDTPDDRLARAGLSWQLRLEHGQWVQTLAADSKDALKRFEHRVSRPDAGCDAEAHAETAVGERLMALLRRARRDGIEVVVRFQTETCRAARKVRTRGAVVEVAFDVGGVVAGGPPRQFQEITFGLISGSAMSMLSLAERWRERFGLIHDPRSEAERVDQAAGDPAFPAAGKGARPGYPEHATATEAFGAVLDECLAHLARNAVGIADGDPTLRVEHVHQLRVAIRRLRSALRSFRRWVPAPPGELVDGLKSLFLTLGRSRDLDVLGSGVMADLAKAGAPALRLPAGTASPDPVEAVRSSKVQQTILSWIAWRVALAHPLDDAAPIARPETRRLERGTVAVDAGSSTDDAREEPAAMPTALEGAQGYHRKLQRRLRRWHKRIAADWREFDVLDDAGLHALRKRIKRQRYAVEFFAPVLPRRKVERYIEALNAIQERMGELNDMFMARAEYQALTADSAAWFALGWLAARIPAVRRLTEVELRRLARMEPPARSIGRAQDSS